MPYWSNPVVFNLFRAADPTTIPSSGGGPHGPRRTGCNFLHSTPGWAIARTRVIKLANANGLHLAKPLNGNLRAHLSIYSNLKVIAHTKITCFKN